MSRVRELGVWLYGDRVAELQAPRTGRITCAYTDAALDRWDLNVPLLSCSLPLRTVRSDGRAFAEGLLPEGQHRQAMAAMAGVPTHDVLGMLARFGRDVAGAVVIGADDPQLRHPTTVPYTADELATEVGELGDHPLGLHDDSELSLAGLQDKVLLVATSDGGWARPVGGYPSTHVLKVDDRLHRGVVRAEHACLQLARSAGLAAARSELITLGDVECIVVERFDRQVTGTTVERVHQEDACQALGIDPQEHRYRAKCEQYGGPRLRQIAGLLDRWGTPADLSALCEYIVFTVAIGNADAHGKNIALLHPAADRIALAPLYDTVPTMLWPALRTTAAMSIGGVTRLPDVTLGDIEAEVRTWPGDTFGGTHGHTAAAVSATAHRLLDALTSGAVDVDTSATVAIETRLRRLLA